MEYPAMNNPHYKSGMWNYELSLWNSDCRNHLGNFLLVPQDVRFYYRDLIQLNKYSSYIRVEEGGQGGWGIYFVRNKVHILLRANFVYYTEPGLLLCVMYYALRVVYRTWLCTVCNVLYLVLYCTVTGPVLCVL